MSNQRFPSLLPGIDTFVHGADYNPDQWLHEPGVIAEDFRLLPLAHMNSWSIGIFAWAALEPQPGQYRFEWMQDILDRAAAQGIHIILATPSGSKPAWLSQAHPEVCRVRDWHGQREPHRARHNHCPSSPVYRREVARINAELSKRFGSHPAVKLWHLSNEYGGECRCDGCVAHFRIWLKQRYGSLDALNQAWWNAFWGHSYNDWEQIHPHEPFHDGLAIDWKRFVTDLTVDFMLQEKAAVRAHSSLPVTTNMMGHYPELDYWRFAPHLDVISNDAYPSFEGRSDETAKLAGAAFDADLMRCLGGGKPWLLMESTPSQLNWTANFVMKRPGVHQREMRLQIGAGADGTCYFQWRKGRGGSEKYHGAVVDHAGHQTRVFAEVAAHGAALDALRPVLGCGVPAEAAIIEDWQMRWGLHYAHGPRQQPKDKGYIDEVRAWHAALTTRGVSCDLIESTADLSSYKLILLPMGYQVSAALGQRLSDFVTGGGILCVSYLSAHATADNLLYRGGWPGAGLRQLCGVWAEEMDGLPDGDTVPVTAAHPQLLAGHARTYCERIQVEDAEVLATYGAEFYAGEAVLTRRQVGTGQAWYVAARMDREFLHGLMDQLVNEANLRLILPRRTPGVYAQERSDGEHRYLFIHNATPQPQTCPLLPGKWRCLDSGDSHQDQVALPPLVSLVLVQ